MSTTNFAYRQNDVDWVIYYLQ